jgi:hypothetical protein
VRLVQAELWYTRIFDVFRSSLWSNQLWGLQGVLQAIYQAGRDFSKIKMHPLNFSFYNKILPYFELFSMLCVISCKAVFLIILFWNRALSHAAFISYLKWAQVGLILNSCVTGKEDKVEERKPFLSSLLLFPSWQFSQTFLLVKKCQSELRKINLYPLFSTHFEQFLCS